MNIEKNFDSKLRVRLEDLEKSTKNELELWIQNASNFAEVKYVD